MFCVLLSHQGQSAAEYLVICFCLVTALLSVPPLFDSFSATLGHKYQSYAFGVAISDPPTVAYDKKVQDIVDALKKFGEKVVNWFANFFKNLVNFFKYGIPNFFKMLGDELKKMWDIISHPEKLYKFITDTITQILDTLWEGIKELAEKILNIVVNIAKAIWDGIKTIAEKIADFILHPLETIKSFIKSLLGFGKEILKWFCGD